MRVQTIVLSVLLTLALVAPVLAQPSAPALTASKTPQTSPDPLGRDTPYGTVVGFLRAAQDGDYARAVDFLDTKQPLARAEDLARQLKVILDRGLRVNLDLLSNKPEGDLADNLPPNQDTIGTVRAGTEGLDIILNRVQRGTSPPIWLFSSETLRQVPAVYAEMGSTWHEEYLPKVLRQTRYLSLPIWQWIAMLLTVPVALALAALLNRLLIPPIRLVVQRLTKERDDRLFAKVAGPIRLFTLVVTVRGVVSFLEFPLLLRLFWAGLTAVLGVIAVTWLLIRLIDILAELTARHLERVNYRDGTGVLSLLSRFGKAAVVTAGGLVLLYMAGVDLTAAIAGLGVGGIAVAFAAQKTLENLFGGIMISSDRPVRVGDFCRFGDQVGTIEDIGLRSTRIRTLDRTIVSVPNGQFAAMSIENFAPRDKIWFHPTIQLRYETSADQLRYVLAGIRRLLYEHPKVESASARIRFAGFGSSSLNLEIFAYILETDYGGFTAIQEDLLLHVMDIVEESGTGFAFPSQTTYIARDPGLHPEKSQAAAAQVQQWRERKEVPFPNFPPEQITKMENTLEYPPADSPYHRPNG